MAVSMRSGNARPADLARNPEPGTRNPVPGPPAGEEWDTPTSVSRRPARTFSPVRFALRGNCALTGTQKQIERAGSAAHEGTGQPDASVGPPLWAVSMRSGNARPADLARNPVAGTPSPGFQCAAGGGAAGGGGVVGGGGGGVCPDPVGGGAPPTDVLGPCVSAI